MIDSRIIDGRGRGHVVSVDDEGALNVVVHPHPPRNEDETSLPYRQRVANSSGVTNMNVDGSTTNVDFYVAATQDRDIYINSISVRIADTASLALNKFGGLTELTNGVVWKWVTQDLGEVILHEGITTNLEFIRTGHKTAAIGDGVSSWLADVSGGGTESAYLPVIDISEQFGKPWGLRLRANSEDRMIFTVRDDLTGLTNFDAICYGVSF